MSEDEIREELWNLLVDFRDDVLDKAQRRIIVSVDDYIGDFVDLYKQEKENRRMAEYNYDELTKTTGRLKTELEEEKKKVRTTIIGRIDQVSLDDLIGDKYISKDKIKTLKENFNKKQSSFMYRSK